MVKILDDEESFSIEYGGPVPPPSGNLWIIKTITGGTTLYRLDTDGNIILDISPQVSMLRTIEFDNNNNLLVSRGNYEKRLYKLDMVGNLIGTIDYPDLPDGWINGLSEDTEGNLWLSLWRAKKICKVTKTGEVLKSFAISPDINGLAYDPDGYLLMALNAGGIEKIDLDGNYVDMIPVPGNMSLGIDVDAYGSIWIVSIHFISGPSNDITKLHKLDKDGTVLKTIDLPEVWHIYISGLTVEGGGT